MSKIARINEYGEIVWPYLAGDIRKELRNSGTAVFDGYSGKHISYPTDLEQVKSVIIFAKKYDIQISPNKKLGVSIGASVELINYFQEKRYLMSKAEAYTGQFKRKLRHEPSPYIKAAILYAIHTRTSLIADTEKKDRQATALIALYQLKGFPTLLICRKRDRESWLEEIEDWLPDIEVFDYLKHRREGNKERIYCLDYEALSGGEGLPFGKEYNSVIVDHALWIKNSESQRTKRIRGLLRNKTYRFLLTDAPVNISTNDLPELLKALGKWDEFGDLQNFLEKSRPNPLDEHRSSFFQPERERNAQGLYYRIRGSCMVRRAEDPGLYTDIEKVGVKALRYSEKFEQMDIRSALRQMGIDKLKDSIRKIRAYREKYPEEKMLILAYHNDVVQELMPQLGVPAIYGKISSESQRESLAGQFRKANAPAMLILANDIEPVWDFGRVDRVIFVELNITPQKYENLIAHLVENRDGAKLKVIFLHTNYLSDLEALQRLELRGKLAKKVLDKG